MYTVIRRYQGVVNAEEVARPEALSVLTNSVFAFGSRLKRMLARRA